MSKNKFKILLIGSICFLTGFFLVFYAFSFQKKTYSEPKYLTEKTKQGTENNEEKFIKQAREEKILFSPASSEVLGVKFQSNEDEIDQIILTEGADEGEKEDEDEIYEKEIQEFDNYKDNSDLNFDFNNKKKKEEELLFTDEFDFQNISVINSGQDVFYSVVKVVDGDTIDVEINGITERIRLIGIDTPETVDPRKTVQCFGAEASAKAKELLENKKVKLEKDETQGDRDKYGRLLRYIHLEDTLFFNLWMIKNGYAREYTYNTPYRYQFEFKQAEEHAKKNTLGLWNPDNCGAESDAKSKNSFNQSDQIYENHLFYTSSYHSSRLYYCDTDLTWKNLSEKYLEKYDSEAELLEIYPNKTLNKPC